MTVISIKDQGNDEKSAELAGYLISRRTIDGYVKAEQEKIRPRKICYAFGKKSESGKKIVWHVPALRIFQTVSLC